MADLLNINVLRATDDNDDPVAGAVAYFYESGTMTPLTVYSDAALTTPHGTSLTADADGVFDAVYVASGTAVKVDIQDPDTLASLTGYPKDPVFLIRSADASAESISATPHTGVSSTTVQAQLEEIQGNIAANTGNAQTIVATGGSSNAYTLTASDTISSYSSGQEFLIRINHANTGAATLNVDSLGAKDLQKYDSAGSLAALASGDLQVGSMYRVHYDGTRFIISDTLVRDDDTLGGTNRTVPSSESVKAYVDGAVLQIGTADTSTAVTEIDFTSLPAGLNRIEITFAAVSTSGTSDVLVQLGTSSTPVTTNYVCVVSQGTNQQSETAGFQPKRTTAGGDSTTGSIVLRRITGNTWQATGSCVDDGGAGSGHVMNGYITGANLGGTLDMVRITTANGSDTFDANSGVNIFYE